VSVAVPRDREGSFEPQLLRKRQERFEGFDEKIIAMYARGMSMREIQGFLQDQLQGGGFAGSDQHGDLLGA